VKSCRNLVAIVLVVASLTATAADDKRLSVYTPQTYFWVTLSEREGRDYVALLDVLGPLGSTSARRDGDKWKVDFNSTQSEFKIEKNKAKVNRKNIDLTSPFILENGRGLVPLHSLGQILSRLLPTPVDVREPGRRVFIGGAATGFTAELEPASGKLVLHFSAPVNPAITSDASKVHITFTRDPVVAPNVTQAYEDKTIRSTTFSEHDSVAEFAVQGGVPLLATVGDQNRTITIAPVPVRAQAAPPPPPPEPRAPAAPPQPAGPQAAPVSHPRATVLIDPGHGGDDRGAALSETLAEKDVTLAFARRLRAALEQKGIPSTLLRESDISLTSDQRASLANAARPLVFLTLHAGSVGTGVRVYTAQLGESVPRPGSFLPWDTAQGAFLDGSRALAGSVVAEIAKRTIPVGSAPVLLRPLNNVSATAIALELMPPASDVGGLMSVNYQQSVCAAIADGIAASSKTAASRSGPPGGAP
jgi:N-acetylmuramoyl-L-alanine amidase